MGAKQIRLDEETQLSYEEILANNIAKAEQQAIESHNAMMIKLASDDSFVESQRKLKAQESELSRLNSMIKLVNEIKPFIASDGAKFSIKAYPVSHFGTGLSQVIGLIQASRSAFTDELSLQFSAITGISTVEWEIARDALGMTSYLSKEGMAVDGTVGNLSLLNSTLKSIAMKLNIKEFNTEITQDRYELWFSNAENKVAKQIIALHKAEALTDNSSEFVLED